MRALKFVHVGGTTTTANQLSRYTVIRIFGFFGNYLECVNPKSLFLAKELFLWKFSVNLRKYEVMRSEMYPEILCRHLGNEFDYLSHMIRNTIKRYYFKYS